MSWGQTEYHFGIPLSAQFLSILYLRSRPATRDVSARSGRELVRTNSISSTRQLLIPIPSTPVPFLAPRVFRICRDVHIIAQL